MRTVAIVQARTGSSRLPRKVLAPICGRPMLLHVVERAAAARRVDEVAVATSSAPDDDAIAELCREHGIACVRGSEQDVLDRYHRAAQALDAGVIVRITGDCPLIDPQVIDRAIEARGACDADYAANVLLYTYPNGLDVEVFRRDALERAWREARLPAEREHVTPYIRTGEDFERVCVRSDLPRRWWGQRWTVDEPADLRFARAVFERLWRAGQPPFGHRAVIELLEREPSVAALVGSAVMHEGTYLSLVREPALPESAGSGAPLELCVQGGDVILGTPSAGPEPADEADARRALRDAFGWAKRVWLARDHADALERALGSALDATGRARVIAHAGAGQLGDPEFEDLDALDALLRTHAGDVAAILVDPAGADADAPGFLAGVRERATRAGALLILDERLSGMRLAPGGAAGFSGIVPDVSCLGPSIADGRRVGAVLAADPGIALPGDASVPPGSPGAIVATLSALRDGSVRDQLWEQGRKLVDGINVMARALGVDERIRCTGQAPHSRIRISGDAGPFRTACERRGLRFHALQCPTLAHDEARIERALRVYRSALDALASGG